MASAKLYPGNGHDVTLTGLAITKTSQLVTGAELTATLFDSKGNAVAGAVDRPLIDVTDQPGCYTMEFDAPVDLKPGSYTLRVTGKDSGNRPLQVDKAVSVQLRRV